MTILEKIKRNYTARLMAIFLVAFLVPVFVTGLLSLRMLDNTIQNTALTEFHLHAANLRGRLESRFTGLRELGQSIANALWVNGNTPSKSEQLLMSFGGSSPLVKRLALVSDSGREIASSDAGRSAQTWDTKLFDHTSVPDFTTGYYLQVKDNKVPDIYLLVPVRSQIGETRILILEIDLLGFWRMVDAVSFGKTGKAELFASSGHVLASPNRLDVIATPSTSYSKVLSELSERDVISKEMPHPNHAFLAAASLSDPPLTVLLRQEAHEVYERSENIRSLWYVILTSCAVLVLMSGYILGRYMTRPLQMISSHAHEISAGNLDVTPLPDRADDIGILFDNINRIVYKLNTARGMESKAAVGGAVSRIAHDLGTPLTALKTFISLLPTRKDDPDFMEDFTATVPDEIRHLESLLDQMREFGKRRAPALANVDLLSLLHQVKNLYRPVLESKDILLSIENETPSSIVSIDTSEMKRVIANLIDNSIKAIGNTGHVSICLSSQKGSLQMLFKDDGPGIPPSFAPELFKPFCTARADGLGLGLANCRAILNSFGGTIQYMEEQSPGTVFVITLPGTQES